MLVASVDVTRPEKAAALTGARSLARTCHRRLLRPASHWDADTWILLPHAKLTWTLGGSLVATAPRASSALATPSAPALAPTLQSPRSGHGSSRPHLPIRHGTSLVPLRSLARELKQWSGPDLCDSRGQSWMARAFLISRRLLRCALSSRVRTAPSRSHARHAPSSSSLSTKCDVATAAHLGT
eukprot:2159603-Rhodomonas_salina.1